MGNRASIILTDKSGDISPTIYLHWNGGPESVLAFLAELKRRGQVGHSVEYSTARLIAIISEFFRQNGEGLTNDGLSLGISAPVSDLSKESLEQVNPGDNGVYIVNLSSEDLETKWNAKKISLKTAEKICKDEGKRYRAGFENSALEKFQGIQKFYLENEAALKDVKAS
ncbi:MAG: hypothetical protein IM559_21095 [Pseudanabaena sp. M151S2SP2A07QC]|nr:hypothetical protein [Pseudanabaena sp. M151S2SP2A07QC]